MMNSESCGFIEYDTVAGLTKLRRSVSWGFFLNVASSSFSRRIALPVYGSSTSSL